VDPQEYRGTAYKISGWSQLGLTSGWKRSAVDFYEQHGRPKQLWVRELVKKACVKLRAAQLPTQWAQVLPKVQPRCSAKAGEIASLMERLKQVLGPMRDQRVVLDGKKIRHAHVESLNAVDGTGRWLGSTRVKEESNEIPAAREQLAKLDIVDKILLADAAHTQVETAGQIPLASRSGRHVG
jgi:hypothetical protein